jgi:predicted DNA-binding protein
MATKKPKPQKRGDPRLTTVRVPREVYARVKALAIERHKEVPWVLGELLEAALEALDDV